jgi:protein TonB
MKKLIMMRRKNSSRYSIALIFSLACHFLAITYLTFKPSTQLSNSDGSSLVKQAPLDHKFDLTKVKFLTSNELRKIKEENKVRQIVANELNGKKERPTNSRFAGEQDQTFDRQTMAKTNGSFKEAGKGSRVATNAVKEKKLVPHKKINFSDLGAFTIYKAEEKTVAEIKASKIIEGIESGKEGVVGAATNNDFVEDVALGDMTNLNTTEFKYYGFYHRIRQKLEQYWGNSIQEKAKKLYKTGRRIPASENMITAITVILDNRGSIIDIKVDGTSGVRELDQAAIESFNKAGPFPNPPKGLLVDGRATIQWGFVVKG